MKVKLNHWYIVEYFGDIETVKCVATNDSTSVMRRRFCLGSIFEISNGKIIGETNDPRLIPKIKKFIKVYT